MLHAEEGPESVNRIWFAAPPAAGAVADRQVRLTAMGRFTGTGRFVCDQVAPRVSLHVVQSGCGTFAMGPPERFRDAESAEYTVGAGDVFAFFPGLRYRYADRPATPWRYTWCMLEGPGVVDALAHIGLTAQHPHLTDLDTAKFEPLFAQIEDAYAGAPASPYEPVAAAWRLLSLLSHRPDTTGAEGRQVASAARTLMELRFATGLTVTEVADRLGVDRSTLFRRFHSEYGLSPKQFLDTVRLGHAQRLLRQGARVAETAALCGFTDAHYFARAYRGTYGHPPSAEPPDLG